jgi:hypothetical protein
MYTYLSRGCLEDEYLSLQVTSTPFRLCHLGEKRKGEKEEALKKKKEEKQ